MDAIQKKILDSIDQNSVRIADFAQDIYKNGETGYQEFRTAGKVRAFFDSLGLPTEEGLAITGVKATLGGHYKRTVALIGELDGVRCEKHPDANPINGIAHACGHHIQLAALVGSALALSDPEVAAMLGANVAFWAVPAEEHVDADVRDKLIAQGRIRYITGKGELIRIGEFDGVDAVVVHHVHYAPLEADVLIGCNSSNGYVTKNIRILGRASHAAAAPEKGINALNAAALGFSAVAYQRETFRDEDRVRVHGIVEKGGGAVNVVPEEVVVEAMVRAKTIQAIKDASEKVDRAFRGAAYALGAKVEIKDIPGYLPVIAQPPQRPLREAADVLGNMATIQKADLSGHNPLSTDVGDLSQLMPVLGFTTGGCTGTLHGPDFRVVDLPRTCRLAAKMMALTAYSLLKNQAEELKEIRERFHPQLTKHEYLAYMDGAFQ
ncbi:amidohydrolase [Ethanoligenens harbinense]|uniref:Amidohydrolase n=1 Tax=Ethanoligenens harbinense (strain DSM 18485 / JCM 12961 / CGMCC 1.5033 / YUAN-3) TaxID=663278 RepID=E6U3R6_ETHHY|nr:amidohydrolase [Ethanoligenens harbinense]ADU26483.1 amidohydrolase [Ethanoligenens harbinense YUAN-3]AVQ95611.1 amidohydrolase [Ethanoligenens harbinense YUAN-3]AYF38275.1 amidohydrolase [Ethanoligenens harbinense]AYF41021.1 amidohydrolase [Ethanoligenens harbinense]QCN91851.1 amidohydrolase [Ethanoligenens harbinense]